MTGDFIEGSTATGVLVAILTTSENLYLHLITRDGDQLQFGAVSDVVGGQYFVSVFVMEQTGLPFNRTAVVPHIVSVMNSKQY